MVFWLFANDTFGWLIRSWMKNSLYSHGLIVLAVCFAVIAVNSWRVEELRFEYKRGLIFLFIAAMALLAGCKYRFPFLTALSFPLFLLGLDVVLLEKKYFLKLALPLILFAAIIPFPFLQELAGYLSFASSRISALLLKILFADVVIDGIVVHIPPDITFSVGSACSGASSVFALLTIALFWVFFFKSKKETILTLFVLTVPVGFIVNILRIVFIFMLARFGSMELAVNFFHDFAAYFFYITSLGLMVFLWAALRKIFSDRVTLRKILI